MCADGTLTQGKILDDLKSMLEVWKDERRSRDISAGLMWENLKYFSVLIIGIITANAFFLKLTIDYPTRLECAGLSLVFPFLIISLAYIGNKDLKMGAYIGSDSPPKQTGGRTWAPQRT